MHDKMEEKAYLPNECENIQEHENEMADMDNRTNVMSNILSPKS